MDIYTLGIETSCDETACAVVKNGRELLSNIIASQADFHSVYGGVVPEIAARMHVEAVIPCLSDSLSQANISLDNIDAICVTCGPGLVGALLVGVSAAKGLSEMTGKPLVPVNHINAHISANYLVHSDLKPPFMALVVSGGHSEIIKVSDWNKFEIIAGTRDDAAGEAIDKIARVLGLGYPGGPKMDNIAQNADVGRYTFPKPTAGSGLDFSFSGIKTFALNLIHQYEQRQEKIDIASFAASYQSSVANVLAENAVAACIQSGYDTLCIAGGVSANSFLRKKISELATANDINLYMPPLDLCTDNAAMVAAAGYYNFINGVRADLSLNAYPSIQQMQY